MSSESSIDEDTARLADNYRAAQEVLVTLNAQHAHLQQRFDQLSEQHSAYCLQQESVESERQILEEALVLAHERIRVLDEQVAILVRENESFRHSLSATSPTAVTSELQNELAQLRNESEALRSALTQKDALLESIITSPSFKLGKKATSIIKNVTRVKR